MERILFKVLRGEAEQGFQYIIGYKNLQDDLKRFQDRPRYQRLVIDFDKTEDPNDAYSRVPYEKGANFLLYLGKTGPSFFIEKPLSEFMLQNVSSVGWMCSSHTSGIMSEPSEERAYQRGNGRTIYMNISLITVARRKSSFSIAWIGM